MTKEEKIQLVEKRIRFLSVWKEIANRRKAFAPLMKIFNLLEADYDKALIPDEKEQIYIHFKSQERIVCSKLGKYLVKNYKDMVPVDHVLSDFVSMLNSIIWKKPPTIVVYKGNDIISTYERCNHSKGVSSCMTKDGRHVRMKFLAMNSDKVEMHCIEDAENIYARCFVWTTDDGKKVVDRIYPKQGDHFHQLLNHYKTLPNYFIRENHNAAANNKSVEINDLERAYVTMNAKGLKEFPYLDTFKFGIKAEDHIILTNAISYDPLTALEFNSQYGYPTEFEAE